MTTPRQSQFTAVFYAYLERVVDSGRSSVILEIMVARSCCCCVVLGFPSRARSYTRDEDGSPPPRTVGRLLLWNRAPARDVPWQRKGVGRGCNRGEAKAGWCGARGRCCKSVHDAHGFTLRVGWRANRSFRAMADFDRTSFEGGASGGGDRRAENAVLARTQAVW